MEDMERLPERLTDQCADAGWQPIETVKPGSYGLVWSPKLPSRNDMRGTVHAYDDGEHFVSSPDANGVTFTHFHSLPAPPVEGA